MDANLYKNYEDNLKINKFIELHLNAAKNIVPHINGFIFWNVSYNKNARSEFLEILYRLPKETGFKFLELIVWDEGHGMPITSKDTLTRQYEDIIVLGEEGEIQKDLELFIIGSTDKKAYFNKKTHKGITNYWRIGTNESQRKDITACFPVALPNRGITLMTSEKDIVVDIFGGAGTTLIAAEKTNRICYMMEKSPEYCDVIVQRWENLTEKKAEKLSSG